MTDEKNTKKAAKSRKSTEPESWVRESLRADEKVWGQIKMYAIQNKLTISQVLNQLMADFVKRKQ